MDVIAELAAVLFSLEMVIAAFAGGAFGAAIGALPAFIFTGILVIAGEAAVHAGGPDEITAMIAFGPPFSPAISFAGGVAAAAYAARKGYMATGFPYHEAKNIGYALGPRPDILAVGGGFGVLGYWLTQAPLTVGMPHDPIAMGVVLSALCHRLFLGYGLVGTVRGPILDMTPFERNERRGSDRPAGGIPGVEEGAGTGSTSAAGGRLVVEPWLPHQYRWGDVAALGVVTGVLGAFIALQTGSAFLAFGISAASLVFLNCGVDRIPVTHHMTLPAGTAALAVTAGGGGLLAGAGMVTALVVGAAFGAMCALFGELFQRVFFAHGDTHWDPPAAAIVFGTFLVALLYFVGVFPDASWVPTF